MILIIRYLQTSSPEWIPRNKTELKTMLQHCYITLSALPNTEQCCSTVILHSLRCPIQILLSLHVAVILRSSNQNMFSDKLYLIVYIFCNKETIILPVWVISVHSLGKVPLVSVKFKTACGQRVVKRIIKNLYLPGMKSIEDTLTNTSTCIWDAFIQYKCISCIDSFSCTNLSQIMASRINNINWT